MLLRLGMTLGLCIAAAGGGGVASAQRGPVPAKFQNIQVPIYVPHEAAAVALIKVGSMHADFQKQGFFRLGLLPMLVLDDVQVEVIRPSSAAAALQGVDHWLTGRSAGRAVELRQVRIQVHGFTTNLLSASVARIASGGQWELSGGVNLRTAEGVQSARRARLHVHGSQSGLLRWADRAETNLFVAAFPSSPVPQPSTTRSP